MPQDLRDILKESDIVIKGKTCRNDDTNRGNNNRNNNYDNRNNNYDNRNNNYNNRNNNNYDNRNNNYDNRNNNYNNRNNNNYDNRNNSYDNRNNNYNNRNNNNYDNRNNSYNNRNDSYDNSNSNSYNNRNNSYNNRNNNYDNRNNNYDNRNNNYDNRNNNYDNRNNNYDNISFGTFFRDRSSSSDNNSKSINSIVTSEFDDIIDDFKKAYSNLNALPFSFKNAFNNEVFISAFIYEVESKEKLPKIVNVILSSMLYSLMQNNKVETEVFAKLRDLYIKKNEKYISQIDDLMGLDQHIGFGVAISIAVPHYKNINVRQNNTVYNFIRQLYSFSEDLWTAYSENSDIVNEDDDGTTLNSEATKKVDKKVKKLIKFMFSDKATKRKSEEEDDGEIKESESSLLSEALIGIFMERKANYDSLKDEFQRNMWNRLTNVTLEIINKMDKADIKELLEEFVERRRVSRNIERRIRILSHIDPVDYKKIMKQAEKLSRVSREYKDMLD